MGDVAMLSDQSTGKKHGGKGVIHGNEVDPLSAGGKEKTVTRVGGISPGKYRD